MKMVTAFVETWLFLFWFSLGKRLPKLAHQLPNQQT